MFQLLLTLSVDAPEELFGEILPWTLLGIGIFVIGTIALMLIRRMIHNDVGSDSEAFTLQTLRDLHASGELTDEQYQKARDSMIGRVSGTSAGADEEPRAARAGHAEQTQETPPETDAGSHRSADEGADKRQGEEPDNGPPDQPPRTDV